LTMAGPSKQGERNVDVRRRFQSRSRMPLTRRRSKKIADLVDAPKNISSRLVSARHRNKQCFLQCGFLQSMLRG
jgi:hypothetical protein